jgi:hypothetical protein
MQMTSLVYVHAFVIILKLKVYLRVQYRVDGPRLESLKKKDKTFFLFKNVQAG